MVDPDWLDNLIGSLDELSMSALALLHALSLGFHAAPSLGSMPSPREATGLPSPPLRSSALTCSEPSDRTSSLALSALPLLASVAAGAPWFGAIYVPMLAIGYSVEAPAGAAALASSLLYSALAALFDASVPLFEIPMILVSIAILSPQIVGVSPPAQTAQADARESKAREDVFADFDLRLKERQGRGEGRSPSDK